MKKLFQKKNNLASSINSNDSWEKEDLGHAGTKEAIEKLKEIIATETDEEKKGSAICALDECQYFYYSPNNPKEEEFLLLKMIENKENELIKEDTQAARQCFKEDVCNLEIRITNKLIKKAKTKQQKETFEIHLKVIQDLLIHHQNSKNNNIENSNFLKTWINEAKSSITVEKYKTIPEDVLKSYCMDFEFYENINH